MKNWKDFSADKYPYSDILKLLSKDNEYRERFLRNRRKLRSSDDDRYPYPYIFNPPKPPDDFAMAPQLQVRAPLKEKDPGDQENCQYCGIKLTKEEQYTHSCKKKPE